MAVLTEAMVKRIDAACESIVRGVGFGTVTIVIEKGRPRRLKQETDEWLERDKDPPHGRELQTA